jgi:hypothetical protein
MFFSGSFLLDLNSMPFSDPGGTAGELNHFKFWFSGVLDH